MENDGRGPTVPRRAVAVIRSAGVSVTPAQNLWSTALETIGPSHIVFGTDYPFARGYEPMIESIERQNLTEDEKGAIYHGTADRLLQR